MTTHATTIVHPTVIGMPSVHGYRIGINEMMISIARMIITDQKIDVVGTKAIIDIVTTDIDQSMTTTCTTTTGMTNMSHDIHGTIGILPIEVHDRRVIIDDPQTIVVVSPLAPNLEVLFNTPI